MTKKKLIKSKKLVGNKRGVRSREARKQLQKVHDRRSDTAQEIDEALKAEIAPTIGHWLKKPNQYDAPGVDTPIDWRSLNEKEKLKLLQSGEFKGATADDNTRLDVAKIRLKWQKKHPFFSAQIVEEYDERFDGLAQYVWAMKSGEDFGFSLHRPQRDFLATYNLKPRDIKGLRVMLIQGDTQAAQEASGFYVRTIKTMFLPPVKRGREYLRGGTVQHEIGHHIYDNSRELQTAWHRGEKVALTKVSERYSKSKKIENRESIPLAEAIMNQKRYFYDLPAANIEQWKPIYEDAGIHGTLLQRYLHNEAFAETFRIYRSGDLKSALKEQREVLEDNIADEEHYRERYEKAKAIPKSKRTKIQQAEFVRSRGIYSDVVPRLKAQRAVVDNYMALIKWMKKHDAENWNFVEEKSTKSRVLRSFNVQTVPKKALLMAKADAKVLKGGMK